MSLEMSHVSGNRFEFALVDNQLDTLVKPTILREVILVSSSSSDESEDYDMEVEEDDGEGIRPVLTFIKKITAAQLRGGQKLHIPKWVVEAYVDCEWESLTVQIPNGDSFMCKLNWNSRGECQLGSPWSNIVKILGLQIGDKVIFDAFETDTNFLTVRVSPSAM